MDQVADLLARVDRGDFGDLDSFMASVMRVFRTSLDTELQSGPANMGLHAEAERIAIGRRETKDRHRAWIGDIVARTMCNEGAGGDGDEAVGGGRVQGSV